MNPMLHLLQYCYLLTFVCNICIKHCLLTFVNILLQMSSEIMEGLSTTKTKKFRVKHPKRKLYRSSEPLLSVFMWGINHTVRELSHISIPVMLMPDDFRAYSKIKIDNHAFNKENLPSHFKVSYQSFLYKLVSFLCIMGHSYYLPFYFT